MIAVMNLLAKLLSEASFHPAELVFYRHLGGLVLITLIIFLYAGASTNLFRTARPKAHIFRGVLGTLGVVLIFGAFAYLPLTTATLLLFTSSLMMPVFGLVFLGEKIGMRRILAVILGFGGVALMTGFSDGVNMTGILLALAGAIANALVHVALRSLGHTEHPLTTSFYFMVTGLVLTAPVMLFLPGGDISGLTLFYLGLLILTGSLSHITKNAMHVNLPVAVSAPFPYTALIWAAIFDILFFGFLPGWSIWAGGAIVIGSNLFLVWREHKSESRAAQQNRPLP